MKNVMQKILIALIGIATISSCSAQEKRQTTGTSANETAAAQAQPAAPTGPTELWNGLFAGMGIDEATEKAKEILKAGKIEQKSTDEMRFYAGKYQVIVYSKDGIVVYDYGTKRHEEVGGIPFDGEFQSVSLEECSESLYRYAYLYFIQGRLIAVGITWQGIMGEDLKSALVKQYGQPRQTIALNEFANFYKNAWQTNSKYICLDYFAKDETMHESNFVDRQWFDETMAAIAQKNREEADAYKEKASGIKL